MKCNCPHISQSKEKWKTKLDSLLKLSFENFNQEYYALGHSHPLPPPRWKLHRFDRAWQTTPAERVHEHNIPSMPRMYYSGTVLPILRLFFNSP